VVFAGEAVEQNGINVVADAEGEQADVAGGRI
jgi:hypothetical protein